MRIKESTIRRILREEYRRVLTEGGDPSVPVEPKAIEDAIARNPTMSNSPGVKAIRKFQSDFKNGDGLLEEAVRVANTLNNSKLVETVVLARTNYLNDVQKKGSNSSYAKHVLTTMQNFGNNKQAMFRAVIASLANNRYYANETAQGGTPYDNDLTLGAAGSAGKFAVTDQWLNSLEFLRRVCSFDLAANFAEISQPTAAPAAAVGTPYTVVKDDTIAKILQNFYNIPMSNASNSLYEEFAAKQNPKIEDITKIAVNQKLLLPPQIGKYKKVK
jgi:hypothetical protein